MKRALTHVSALAIAAGMAVPAMAESQSQTGEQQQQMQSEAGSETTSGTESSVEAQASGAEAAGQAATEAGEQQEDRLVATVGDDEIRQSDVLAAVEALPPRVQQTPPQTLLPAVVDQLIMRSLIADEARAEGLESDAEVKELVASGDETAMEQALVEVWLTRELDERVTDAEVEKAVEEMAAENPDVEDTAALEPQVRQALQVKAMTDIGDALRKDAEITFYGPDGEPVEASEQAGSGAEGESATGGAMPESEPKD